MKKTFLLTFSICLLAIGFASAQVIPSFSFGAKAGLNFSAFPANGKYDNSSQAGYLGGVWARFGALGFNFQPELYATAKNLTIKDDAGNENKAKFTSLDVPLLIGTKIGAFGLGGRFYGGPVFSFTVNRDQSYSNAAAEVAKLNYKDANYGVQLGAGLDIKDFSVDLRYEGGLNKISYGPGYSHTRVSIFSLSLAYKIFSL
ncbi:porin family protein [Mucilaginibacter ginsenosidivorax]|uniref:PorT family protein n=1 Tax=Mucilaginibacter ginsenosidivorax TaxID=862126 RepID=A0A5B8W876_9SPHI|nr:porin family protein [Mucilaginibacter ginsenosidivorax]QEC79973.1 PorT family protein [Mucilaginibacter ginsenosidivorax]